MICFCTKGKWKQIMILPDFYYEKAWFENRNRPRWRNLIILLVYLSWSMLIRDCLLVLICRHSSECECRLGAERSFCIVQCPVVLCTQQEGTGRWMHDCSEAEVSSFCSLFWHDVKYLLQCLVITSIINIV